MATMNVLDSAGGTVAIEKPLAPGTAADSASRPVAWSTEGKAQLGAVAETAPASDTASSGLNGRLQRIAQRITSMIALLPTALGAGGGLKVDGSGTALPVSQSGSWVIAAGAAVIGAVTQSGSWVLSAGSAIIGKVGIDQTTDLTTNKVRAFIHDGTTALPVLAASTGAPAASSPALPVSIRDVNGNGLALPANSAPVVVAPQTLAVAVTPTVTASAYTANNVIGGIMTFANILPTIGNNGVLQSITARFKGTAVTGNINVAIFKASPSNGTYTDKTAATWNAADMANLVGIFQLPTPLAIGAATMTVYSLDGIGRALVGASTSLYAVVTVAGTPTPASTSDFTLELSVLPG